eukprot:12746750-Alexandrium_andersonii.AAC.1
MVLDVLGAFLHHMFLPCFLLSFAPGALSLALASVGKLCASSGLPQDFPGTVLALGWALLRRAES